MTITLADSYADTSGSVDITIVDTTDIANTADNLQVLFWTHRGSTRSAELVDASGGTNGDWNGPYLIETLITNSTSRRAIAWAWRKVPGDAGNFTVGWDADRAFALNLYEFTTTTSDPTWALDSSTSAFSTDQGASDVTSIQSVSVDPGNEGVAVFFVCTRHGTPGDSVEHGYNESFTTGLSVAESASANKISGFSGYRITNVAVQPTATWTTAAQATSAITAFSVTAGSPDGTAPVAAIEPNTTLAVSAYGLGTGPGGPIVPNVSVSATADGGTGTGIAKVWNGSSWGSAAMKVWNGSSWDTVSGVTIY